MADEAGPSNRASNEPHPKRVLLFGRTGSGKSTVANALVTGGLERVVFPIAEGSFKGGSRAGCTQKIQIEAERGWTVVDTVGLGDSESGSSPCREANHKLISFLNSVKNEYSHIIYVIKAGRPTETDEKMWKKFVTLFEGGEEGFVILLTAVTGEKFLDRVPEYLKLPGCPIMATNIPPTRKSGSLRAKKNDEIRKDSITKLETGLEDLFRERNYKLVVPKIVDDESAEDLGKQPISMKKKGMKRWLSPGSVFNFVGFIIGVVSLAIQEHQ